MAVDVAGDVLTSRRPAGGAKTWKSTNVGAKRGSGGDEFVALSCPSVRLCLVSDVDGDILSTTTPSGPPSGWASAPVDVAHNLEVMSIDCTSVRFCVAGDQGGDILTTSHPRGGALAWKFARVDFVAGTSNEVNVVSCTGERFCLAGASGSAGNFLLESSDPEGGPAAWKRLSGIGSGAPLGSLLCRNPHFCVASDVSVDLVTSQDPAGGAQAWPTAFTNPTGPNTLTTGISCPSTRLCVVVGDDLVVTGTPR
ncbi:MAG TPA: hypothetical protein VME20_14485 [Acidimicrobiales bacterium]|nr:hypothetical protein [Acidimicrobiales bacterium]